MSSTYDPGSREKSLLINQVLGHSYLVYFASVVIGLVLDYRYPIRIMSPLLVSIGPLLIILATVLIYWAQDTSAKTASERHSTTAVSCDSFCKGPYSFLRSPTHVGLVSLCAGLGLLLNSVFILCGALIAFILTRYLYVRREEGLLKQKYGQSYLEYKQKVKF